MEREAAPRRVWLWRLVAAALAAATCACVAEPAPPYRYYDWYAVPYYGPYAPGLLYWRGGWRRPEARHGTPHAGAPHGGPPPGGSGGHRH